MWTVASIQQRIEQPIDRLIVSEHDGKLDEVGQIDAFEHFADESQLAKVEQEPILFLGLFAQGELDHFGDVAGCSQNIVFQLDVVGAARLSVHHQKGVVQVLLGAPFDPLHRIVESNAHFVQIRIEGGWRSDNFQ